MDTRLDTIRRLTREAGAGAALVTFLPDVRWAVGFTGSNAVLAVTPDAAHFVTDGRYDAQARQEVRGATVHAPGYALLEHLSENGLLGGAARVVIQAEHVPVATLERLQALFPPVAFVPVSEWLVAAIAAKDEGEIEKVRAAQRLTGEVFEAVLPYVQPGVTERDIAAEIVYQLLKRGAERPSFDPIVASGLRGALPHARPTTKAIRAGDMVVMDLGGVLDGYAGDLTRTVAVGDPPDEARRVYELVRDAQRAGMDVIAAGKTGKEADTAARGVIEAAGLGAYFPHSLGHGVGLQTHEWPRLSQRAEDVLPAGATVTVEPGVYLPERFGVRIEDVVVVREGGCEVVAAPPSALLVL